MNATTATNPPTWHETGDGLAPARGIASVEAYIRRFCVLPDAAYLPVTIWTVATHTADSFDCFPYLALFSPAKRCGKTRLQEVLEQLVHKPWRGTAPSSAATYRMLAAGPTLLADEVEVLSRKDKSEATQTLLAVLNAGHRKGATIPRCDGPKHELRHFPVYGPKSFAAIGRLPDTLTDRSIVVTLQRRTPAQKIARFLISRAAADARPIRDSIVAFTNENHDAIAQAYAKLMASDLDFLEDRAADLWMPMFATCAVAAPERLAELRTSAVVLTAAKAADDGDSSLPLKLLADIRVVWPRGHDRCDTANLIGRLRDLEESPWGDFGLSPRKLARMLRPFEVEARGIRVGTGTPRGYQYRDLEVAFSRYLEVPNATPATSQ